jgi:hypothetical protein
VVQIKNFNINYQALRKIDMINDYDIKDWDDKPKEKPLGGVNVPTGHIPLNFSLKQLLVPSIGLQIDFGIKGRQRV